MASDETRVFVLGGKLFERDETALIHVFGHEYVLSFVITFVEFENPEHTKFLAKYPNSNPNDAKPSDATTQLAWNSSASPPTLMEADDCEGPAEHRANSAVPDASFDGDALLSHHSHDQQVRTLEQALQKATSLTAEADERSQRAYEQIGKYETELAAVRLRLADAENDWPKSKRGADALRARTMAGLAGTNDRNTPESASLRSNDKNSELIQFRNEG
jgi:hypothetical protein